MCTRSSPFHTISHSDNSLAKNHLQHLKSLYLQNQQPISTTTPCTNQLPLNLFLSPTQYHKMIITKGKSRKINHSDLADTEITTLQYHNDPIFLKQNLIKSTPIHRIKPSLNQSHLQTNPFKNSSNKKYQNAKKHKNSNLSNSNSKKPQSTIECDQLHSRKRPFSATQKPKRKNSKNIKNSRKNCNSINKSQIKKSIVHDDQNAFYIPKRSKSQRSTDISHLIIKSLIDFTQSKKAQKQAQTQTLKLKEQKQQHLKQLNQQIRIYNLHHSRVSKSKSKQKSFTKQDLALDYWDHIKEQVLNSLKNDNYSQPLKQHLRNYNFNVYDHKEIPKRKMRLSKKQIGFLMLQHEEQAKSLIKHQQREKRLASQKIKKNLKDLQKQRRKRIRQTSKKPFNPTAQMIRSAFQNNVEPEKLKRTSLSPDKKGESLFRNEKIKMKHAFSMPRN